MDVFQSEHVPDDPRRVDGSDWRREAIQYAIRAPSGHNTQPWQFRLIEGGVDLLADRSRALPVSDPNDRELTIACGAALLCLRLAFLHLGRQPLVDILPDAQDSDLLARVTAGEAATLTPEEWELFAEIPRRHTNRRLTQGGLVPVGVPLQLEREAAAEGAWLQIVPSDVRDSVVELVAEGDRRLWANPAYRRELAEWIHPEESGDGLVEHYRHGFGPLVVRAVDLGKGRAQRDGEVAANVALLAVLGTKEDGPRDWLAAGQALARVLLRANAYRLDAAFLNQPVQIPESRVRLARSVGRKNQYPQLVVCVGTGPNVAPAPRRPLEDVIVD